MPATVDRISQCSEEPGVFENYLNEKWGTSKPLVKLFRTDSRGYLYDTGTNKILGCHEYVFHLLERLLITENSQAIQAYVSEYGMEPFHYAAETIKSAIENESILLEMKASHFELLSHDQNYEDLIDSSLEILFLEVTENCNLRCGYCVYNCNVKDSRDHGSGKMTLSTAYQAIDYLKTHSFKRDKVAVAFYGGEPLLEFPLIQACVEYAKSNLEIDIDFSITTNGTLLTHEIAMFFYENDFDVFVSIDGPEEIHDRYRIDAVGNGSFSRSINGLKELIKTYKDLAQEKINLSMVYTPPFSGQRIDRVSKLWEELPWLPRGISLNITYPRPGTLPGETLANESQVENKSLQDWAFEKFLDWYTEKGESLPMVKSIIEADLAKLMQRPVFKTPHNNYSLNGCCIPGVKRIYVATDGKFHACERIDTNAPTIGDVRSGIDFHGVENTYIEGYKKMSAPVCSTCWAARLCSSCYIDAFDDGRFEIDEKNNKCNVIRYSQEKIMKYYCTLIEREPSGLDYLYDYQFFE
jgi:uncharacterized protein